MSTDYNQIQHQSKCIKYISMVWCDIVIVYCQNKNFNTNNNKKITMVQTAVPKMQNVYHICPHKEEVLVFFVFLDTVL